MAEAKGKAGADAPADPAPKPKGAPRQKGAPAKTAQPKPAVEPTGEPSVHVKMSWVAIGIDTAPGYQVFEGLVIDWPKVSRLNLIGAGDKNTLICVRPKDWVDALVLRNPRIKVVKGRLPDLVLYKTGEGNNTEVWAEYQKKHPPYGVSLTAADWEKALSHSDKD